MANQTYRVLELIKRFNNNEQVCISDLQYEDLWEGKSEKTIRRDLDIIKKVFPDTFHLIKGEQGCYKAVTNELFSNITSAENMSLLVQTFNIADRSNLFSDLNIDTADKSILEKNQCPVRQAVVVGIFQINLNNIYAIHDSPSDTIFRLSHEPCPGHES